MVPRAGDYSEYRTSFVQRYQRLAERPAARVCTLYERSYVPCPSGGQAEADATGRGMGLAGTTVLVITLDLLG